MYVNVQIYFLVTLNDTKSRMEVPCDQCEYLSTLFGHFQAHKETLIHTFGAFILIQIVISLICFSFSPRVGVHSIKKSMNKTT